MAANTKLSTKNYVPPGSYNSQIILPSPSSIPSNTQIPCLIGKGSRLAFADNVEVRRSYVYEESLTFSAIAPYRATLSYYAKNNQDISRLYDANGVSLRRDQWRFVKVGSYYSYVEINVEAFDTTTTYYIDYQSIQRSVKDQLSISDIREMITVGDQKSTSQYVEYTHYYIENSITGPTAGESTPHVSGVAITGTHSGHTTAATISGTWSLVGSESNYAGKYNRQYTIEVNKTSGDVVEFVWYTPYVEFAHDASPSVPLNPVSSSSILEDTRFLEIPDAAATSSTTFNLELGVSAELSWDTSSGAGAFHTGDTFTFSVATRPYLTIDPRYSNTNQFPEVDDPASTGVISGNGVISINDNSTLYTGGNNGKYRIQCSHASGDHYYLAWQRIDPENIVAGNLHINPTATALNAVLLNAGIYLDFTCDPPVGPSGWFVTGDTFTFDVKGARIFYRGKDDRNTKLVVTQASSSGDHANIIGYANSDTVEGNYQSFQITSDYSSATYSDKDNKQIFNDNFIVYFKNGFCPTTSGVSIMSYTGAGTVPSADSWDFTFTTEDNIIWDLDEKTTENINSSEIYVDVLGNITGTPNTKYIVLENIPKEIYSIRDTNPSGDNTYFVSGTNYTHKSGTGYIYFDNTSATQALISNTPLVVNYLYNSAEPEPGDIYHMSANYIRPDSLYNTPILIGKESDGDALLKPASRYNDLYIGHKLAWENEVNALYVIQVKDSDGDGVYNKTDYQNALEAAEAPQRISDIIVLNKWEMLTDQLKHINKMSDPFKRRFRLGWFGAPIGTEIGDRDSEGTLVYWARNTLQVYGASPTHGTRILIGNNEATKTITLSNGTSLEVNLDGSFIAAAICARVRGFNNLATTVLKKQIYGFDSITTYGDSDSYENKTLGGASVIYLLDQKDGVYIAGEDVTVDDMEENFHLIMNMAQKQYVTSYVNNEMNNKLVSIVSPTPQDSVEIVSEFLVDVLGELLKENIIAPYIDENGNSVPLNPQSDIYVYEDSSDKNKVHYMYSYYLHRVLKRLFGVYVVDRSLNSVR